MGPRLASVAAGLACVLSCVVAAPQEIRLDPTRIYTPGDLKELQIAIAYEKCLNTPGCDTSVRSGNAMCQEGGGVDVLMRDKVGVRTGGAQPDCNSLVGEVLWPETGQCVTLLTQGPCQPGQWVKLRHTDLQPTCASKPCGPNSVIWEGDCRPPGSIPVTSCPPSQRLILNEFGEGECDCDLGLVYYEGTKMCYTPYTQGPCLPGHIIKVVDAGVRGLAQCFRNPCPRPNMVRLDNNCRVVQDTGTCHTLDTPGPCEDQTTLRIDNTISEPLCITTHSIFSSIGPRCSRGSLRDNRGRCRTNFARILRELPPIVTSKPNTNGDQTCPKGQMFMAGICIRLAFS
ncbi:hypothetical protein Pmani_026847 [Petrolisthes manimaculis]|uniref:DUF4789 domain-containing protein n=1 Tax=Petrolisthes manimaculis TaxID=1843537 RepID=A0AAE1P2P6_9EUCA|nr:hypothetical protein Pmani_026847 [Petrolisthes manimaculis]